MGAQPSEHADMLHLLGGVGVIASIVNLSTQQLSLDGRVVGGFEREHTVSLTTCVKTRLAVNGYLGQHNLTVMLLTWTTLRYALNAHGISGQPFFWQPSFR